MDMDIDTLPLPVPPSGSGTVSTTSNKRFCCGYEILETLGKGMSGKVKRARHPQSNEIVALKIIDRSSATRRHLQQLQTEIMTMKALEHDNIVRLYHVDLDCDYPRKNGLTRKVMTLAIELCTGGELFDFLMHTQAFQEDIGRTFFAQLLTALHACHQQGIYHRDIKPENLLLDSKFQLKIADFGLASMKRDPDELLRTECGTKSYMAPEILAHRDYDGVKADVWSSAVVLFIMLAGNPPFQHAKRGDWWFDRVCEGNYDKFWRAHVRYCPNFPMLARHCINSMFVPDPAKRPTTEEVMKHPWLQGKILSPEELYDELYRRKLRVDRAKKAEREQAQREKMAKLQRMSARQRQEQYDPFARNVHRSVGGLCMKDENLPNVITQAPKFEDDKNYAFTNFYSPNSAKEIMEQMKKAIDTLGGKVKVKNDYSWKTSLKLEENECEYKVQIYSVSEDDTVNFVEVVRSKGDLFTYKKAFNILLESISDLLVDEVDEENSNNVETTTTKSQEVEEVGEDTEKPSADEDLSDDLDMI